MVSRASPSSPGVDTLREEKRSSHLPQVTHTVSSRARKSDLEPGLTTTTTLPQIFKELSVSVLALKNTNT
jgi:hypothetical protein